MAVAVTDDVLAGHDEEQVRLMAEMCIQTDEDDNAIGGVSKKSGGSRLRYFLQCSNHILMTVPVSASNEQH